MSQSTAPRKSHLIRNIGIAVVIIVVVVAGLYAVGLFSGGTSPFGPPFGFTLSVSPTSGTAMQGGSLQASVSVALSSGSPRQVALSASGPSGVTCDFSPQAGDPPYTSTLTISIPESLPTAAYSLLITATGGGVTQSSTYALSVLSAQVTVSGTITTKGIGTHATNIEFVSLETGQTFTAIVVSDKYTISLPNQQTYHVTGSWSGWLGMSGTYTIPDNVTVNAGVGTTAITLNLTD